jgi:hypothetical protein
MSPRNCEIKHDLWQSLLVFALGLLLGMGLLVWERTLRGLGFGVATGPSIATTGVLIKRASCLDRT